MTKADLKANPEVTIAGAMSFSTADAPYFLGMRRAKGLSPDNMRKRIYPNAETAYQRVRDAHRPNAPAVNFISLCHHPTPWRFATAGHTILIVSAGVTA